MYVCMHACMKVSTSLQSKMFDWFIRICSNNVKVYALEVANVVLIINMYFTFELASNIFHISNTYVLQAKPLGRGCYL